MAKTNNFPMRGPMDRHQTVRTLDQRDPKRAHRAYKAYEEKLLRPGQRTEVHLPDDNRVYEALDGPCRTYRMKPDTPEAERATWPEDLQRMWKKRFGG